MTSPTVFLTLRISVSHGPVVYTQNVSTNFSYQGRILYLDFVFVSHREKRKWRLVRLWFSARTNQTVVTFPRSTGSFFFLFSFLAFFFLFLYTLTPSTFLFFLLLAGMCLALTLSLKLVWSRTREYARVVVSVGRSILMDEQS